MGLTANSDSRAALKVPQAEPLRLAPESEAADRKFSESYRYGQLRLCKRADSGIWRAVYRNARSGRMTQRSFGTTLKKEAERMAANLTTQLTNGKVGVADGTIPLTLLIEKYFTAKNGRIKTKSFKRVKTTQARFTAWLETAHTEVRLAKHLTTEIVREYQSHRLSAGLSSRTVNNDIKNLHSIFKWGVKEHLVADSPFDYSDGTGTIDLYTLPPSEVGVYTEAEYLALVAEAERRSMTLIRDLIVVLAGTGMRFEELANLRLKNVHWDTPRPTLQVRAQNGWTPKDPREIKDIPMLPEVQEVVRRRSVGRQDTEAFLFTNTVGNKVHEGWTLEKLKELFPAVGINGDRRLYWHSFRNYFVIRCLKKGVIVPALMKWTGHDSATMVLHYAAAIQQSDVYAEFGKVS